MVGAERRKTKEEQQHYITGLTEIESSLHTLALLMDPEKLQEPESSSPVDLLKVLENETSKDYKLKLLSKYQRCAKSQLAATMIEDKEMSSFLLACTTHSDVDVVDEALKTFLIFTADEKNIEKLKRLEFLNESLEIIVRNSTDDKLMRKAQWLLRILKGQKTSVQKSYDGKENIPFKSAVGKAEVKKPRRSKETLIYVANGVLEHMPTRKRITQALVSVKGIMSVTYKVAEGICVILQKSHIPPENFGIAVADLGIECFLMDKEAQDKKELKLKPISRTAEGLVSSMNKLDVNVPDYLSEDDYENVPDNAVTSKGFFSHTTWSLFGAARKAWNDSFFW